MMPAAKYLTLALLTLSAVGQPKQTKEQLQTAINDLHVLGNDFWVYNDLAGAVEQAKKTNKPIFVTFRCVPCKNCAGFDAEVASGNEGLKKLAQDHFIPLRQVEMKGVDLSQFQFDYDLNWAAMFINADGTVYGRYGTQSIDGPDAYNSIKSLEKSMARVLELHANYDKVKDSLQAKKGAQKPYKTGMEMPGMLNTEKLVNTTARNNCIHCHMIHDAENRQWQKDGTMSMDKLYRYPLPDNIGMHIDPNDGRVIEKITADGPAAKAGLAVGDDITHVNGQPIISIADIQWVLHNTPNEDAKVEITINRAGKPETKTVAMSKGWKKIDFAWRGSRWSLRPEPGFWGPALDANQTKALAGKIPAGTTPIRIQYMGNKDQSKACRDAGLKEGDVILAIDGQPFSWTPQDFQMKVRLEKKKGDTIKYTLLRNGKEMEVTVPLIE